MATALTPKTLPARSIGQKQRAPTRLFVWAFILTLAGPVVIAISQAVGVPHQWLHPSIAAILVGSTIPTLVDRQIRHRPFVWSFRGLVAPLTAIGFLLFAFTWSPQPEFARDKAQALLLLCLLPGLSLAAARLHTEGRGQRAVALARASRLVLSLAFGALILLGRPAPGGRLILGEVNPIWFARGLVMLGIAASTRTSRFSAIWPAAVAVACVAIGARSAALVMIGVLLYGYRDEIRNKSQLRVVRLLRTISSATIAAVAIYYLMIIGLLRAPDDFSAVVRSRLWIAAAEQLRYDSSLLHGQGLASFKNILNFRYNYPHNVVLELLLDGGLLALSAVVFSIRRGLRHADGVLAVCLVSAFLLALTSGDIPGNGQFFVLLFAVNAVKQCSQNGRVIDG